MFLLKKKFYLIRPEYEELLEDVFQFPILERNYTELNELTFKMGYIIKYHPEDTDRLEETFKRASELNAIAIHNWGELLMALINILIDGTEFTEDDLADLFASDIEMDSQKIEVDLILLSENEKFLEFIDDAIESDGRLKIYPEKFYRYSSNSYNDAIESYFPELFDREGGDIGRDDDAVFVHNFTFQTSENCNLNCSYCLSPGTKILMADFTEKPIEEIVTGDVVLGCNEHLQGEHNYRKLIPTEVMELYRRKVDATYRISSPWLKEDLVVTGNHPILTSRGWVEVKDLLASDELIVVDNRDHIESYSGFTKELVTGETEVYNFATTEHTYVANNVVVHNCYQGNKSASKMTLETGKAFVDALLSGEYGYINDKNSPALIIEFIGGDPFLEMPLTRKIYEYFLERTYELDHPWFEFHRVSLCSNGLLYFDPEVQDFFNDFAHKISFNISIDGNKELHDACRVQPNGEGSYEVDMAALKHYTEYFASEKNSKMTLAPSNIKYLFESVIDFISQGMSVINLNCIFEEGWTCETARLEYEELKRLADYILENDLEHIFIAIFSDAPDDRWDGSFDGNFCGGTGAMLSMGPDGAFYPCLRYMPSSIGDSCPQVQIGNVHTGMEGRAEGSEILSIFSRITRRSQSTDICYNCPIGSGCAWCSANCHQTNGTADKRTTFHCIQTIAESLANVYYWNLLNIKQPAYNLGVRKNNVPDEWALKIISPDELDFLKAIENRSAIATIDYDAAVHGDRTGG